MAARCPNLLRSTLQGLYQISNKSGLHQWTHRVSHPRMQQNVVDLRTLHSSQCSSQTITNPESQMVPNTQRAIEPDKNTRQSQKQEEEEDEEEDEEENDVPPSKPHPMKIIAYAWLIGLPSGVLAFLLTKRQIDKNRLKNLKVRQRMKKAIEEDDGSSRYKTFTRSH